MVYACITTVSEYVPHSSRQPPQTTSLTWLSGGIRCSRTVVGGLPVAVGNLRLSFLQESHTDKGPLVVTCARPGTWRPGGATTIGPRSSPAGTTTPLGNGGRAPTGSGGAAARPAGAAAVAAAGTMLGGTAATATTGMTMANPATSGTAPAAGLAAASP